MILVLKYVKIYKTLAVHWCAHVCVACTYFPPNLYETLTTERGHIYWMVAKTGHNLEQSKQILVCVQAREAGQYHCLHWGHKYFAWSLVYFAYQSAPALPPSSSLRQQTLTLSINIDIFLSCKFETQCLLSPTTGVNSCHTTVCWHQMQSVY